MAACFKTLRLFRIYARGGNAPRLGRITNFIYDPQDRTRDFFRLEDLFSQGIILGGEMKVDTQLFGKKGAQHIGGIGGYSPLASHRGDRFGIGAYYVGASNEFGPIPQAIFGPGDGRGAELFYNFQVNPWLNVTLDVQCIKPEASAIANEAFVYGLRLNMTL